MYIEIPMDRNGALNVKDTGRLLGEEALGWDWFVAGACDGGKDSACAGGREEEAPL
jgi:hypothetical protein